MALCFAVTSGKGGTGKSTVSSGLAISFSRQNKKVLIVDLDEGLRCLDLFFGIDEDIVFDLSDAFSGRSASDVIYKVKDNDLIDLIPAPASINKLNAENLADFITKQCQDYDIIILDMPAGVDLSVLSVIAKELFFITVSNADPVSVRDAAAIAALLPEGRAEPRLIINRFEPKLIKKGLYDNIDVIIDKSCLRLIGIVPNDDELMLLPVNHSLKKRGKASKSLSRIALRLSGADVQLPKLTKI